MFYDILFPDMTCVDNVVRLESRWENKIAVTCVPVLPHTSWDMRQEVTNTQHSWQSLLDTICT